MMVKLDTFAHVKKAIDDMINQLTAEKQDEIDTLTSEIVEVADKKAHEAASEKDHKAFIEESPDYSAS